MSSSKAPPKVFISYSHDSLEHRAKVWELAERLRSDGINAVMDQYTPDPEEGFPRWVARQIDEADFVLLVATETYARHMESREERGRGHGVKWEGAASVDGKPWPVADSSTVWLPAGTHTLEPGAPSSSPRVLDFNGELVSAERRGGSSVEVSYQSSSRALALVDRKPVRLELDGGDALLSFLASGGNYTLVLPRGQHLVTIHTE